jgi:DNA invertase Pin-like site-specific DNA recombinase
VILGYARSVAELCAIVARIERKGASLRILAMNLDTASPTGRLMLNVIGSVHRVAHRQAAAWLQPSPMPWS